MGGAARRRQGLTSKISAASGPGVSESYMVLAYLSSNISNMVSENSQGISPKNKLYSLADPLAPLTSGTGLTE